MKKVKYMVVLLALIILLAILLPTCIPHNISLPGNCTISVWGDGYAAVPIEGEMQANILSLISNLSVKRELIPYDGYFSAPVPASDFCVIDIRDGDDIVYGLPVLKARLVLVYSNPSECKYVLPSTNNRNKYVIVPGDVLNDLLLVSATAAQLTQQSQKQ